MDKDQIKFIPPINQSTYQLINLSTNLALVTGRQRPASYWLRMHTTPDNELIGLVLQGNTAVYAELVEHYRNFVFTIVLRYVKSREDAEEVSQDVFVKAYRSLAISKAHRSSAPWLYTIATTTCLSFLRKKKLAISRWTTRMFLQPPTTLTVA